MFGQDTGADELAELIGGVVQRGVAATFGGGGDPLHPRLELHIQHVAERVSRIGGDQNYPSASLGARVQRISGADGGLTDSTLAQKEG